MSAATPIAAPNDVRQSVREALTASPEFMSLDPAQRRAIASAVVRLCNTAAALRNEELESEREAHDTVGAAAPLATAQAAGDEFSGVAAERVAGTTQAILNAVSFPRFVSELLNGVFKAILDTNMQQLDAYVDLINNVSATTDGFADANLGPDRAREWLADRYPGSFELSGDDEEEREAGEPPERSLRLRPGGSPPSPEALRADLGLAAEETMPVGDPERTLVPLARRRLAKTRQEMLATMVMLGMQRIVIDSGKVNAAMRFHIDTRSAAQDDRGSTLDFRNTLSASGTYGTGIWGVSASMQNTIGYVSTQRTQTTEEMNTDLDLNSSVEVLFRSDYLPLNRLASADQAARIRENSRNPEEETAAAARKRRTELASESDEARRTELSQRLATPTVPPPPASGAAGSPEDAERARRQGASGSSQNVQPAPRQDAAAQR